MPSTLTILNRNIMTAISDKTHNNLTFSHDGHFVNNDPWVSCGTGFLHMGKLTENVVTASHCSVDLNGYLTEFRNGVNALQAHYGYDLCDLLYLAESEFCSIVSDLIIEEKNIDQNELDHTIYMGCLNVFYDSDREYPNAFVLSPFFRALALLADYGYFEIPSNIHKEMPTFDEVCQKANL